MKLAVCVPMPVHVPPLFIRNLVEVLFYTRGNLKGLDSLMYMDQGGVRTDKNRNLLIEKALEAEMDYILWLDADMTYPADIVCKYMENPVDIVGCIYFKRKHPFDPVLYVNGDPNNKVRPYRMVDPTSLPENQLVEVDGLGFGGVLVNTNVYKQMGDDKYMKYGDNFHLPYETEDQLTHDLVWCRNAKKHGFKVHVHTGVVAKHIQDKEVGIEDFIASRPPKKEDTIAVIMPCINVKKAKKTAKQLSDRAGIKHKMLVVEDIQRSGFIATANSAVKDNPSDYYVYVAEDSFAGRDWLKIAYDTIKEKKAGLLGFNDGKWQGAIASFGMVSHAFMVKNYNGDLFYSGYNSHYADTELTMIALRDNTYCYNPHAVLTEVDSKKELKKVNKEDQKLFNERKYIISKEFAEMYA